MTARRTVGWADLNAYVDGALLPEQMARVARAVASDPALARQVSLIRQLKDAVRASPGETPPMLIEAPVRKPRTRTALLATVAAMTGFVFVAGLALSLLTAPDQGAEAWLVRARALHAEWSGRSRAADSLPLGPRLYLSATRQLGIEPYFPDLSSARLRLAGVRLIPAVDGWPAALQARYVGTRGCRVSLWITKTGETGTSLLVQHIAGGPVVYSWRTGGLHYALLSSGMESERFRLIAEASYKATISRAAPDAETRTVLSLSRTVSAPCRG